MMDLTKMGIKELRTLGKEHEVKEWWSMNKTRLIEELSKILEPKPEQKPQIKKQNLKLHELTYAGKTQTIREWADELKMPWATLYDRVNRNGWTVEEALTIPLGERRKRK